MEEKKVNFSAPEPRQTKLKLIRNERKTFLTALDEKFRVQVLQIKHELKLNSSIFNSRAKERGLEKGKEKRI